MSAPLLGGLGIGAGVGISSVALAPFNAANTFMGSAFFGYGMILGERYMYQSDWPKIQARLENGEKIENIIQEYTGTFTAVVMKEAKIIFDTVTQEFIRIMAQALQDATGGNPPLTEEEIRRRSRGGGGGAPQPKVQPNPQYVPEPEKFLPKSGVPDSVIRNVKSWVRDINSIQVRINTLQQQYNTKLIEYKKRKATGISDSAAGSLDLAKIWNRLNQQKALRNAISVQLNKSIAIYGTKLNPYIKLP